ncbi:MAG: sel1 repeat family protein [Deltaproteobacteria bacterium]|nr:sel1 repeat family protein [Deltaproteobacteria bacterium]
MRRVPRSWSRVVAVPCLAAAALACGPGRPADPPRPETTPPPPAAGSAAQLAACRDGDAASCLAYAEDGPESSWANRSDAYYRACDLGEPAACCAVETSLTRGDEEFDEQTIADCRTACAAGHLESCAGLGGILAHDLLPVAGEPLLLSYCTPQNDVGCEWFVMPLFLYDDASLLTETFRLACDGGGPHGCLMLGRALSANDGRDEAEAALRTACDAGVPDGCTELARILRVLDRDDEAIEVLSAACPSVSTAACHDLAEMLESASRTAEADVVRREGCDAGDGGACEALASSLLEAGDPEAAAPFVRRACDDNGSCWKLAEIAERLGTAESLAAEYREACDRGDAVGCLRLGSFLEELEQASEEFPEERAEESAAAWRRGCELGLSAACTQVGNWENDVSEESQRLDAELFYRTYCVESTRRRCDDMLDGVLFGGGRMDELAGVLREHCEAGDAVACSRVDGFADEGDENP